MDKEMKILLVADGRSPITRSWIRGLSGRGHTLELISSYPCDKPPGITKLFILPLAFSGLGRSSAKNTPNPDTKSTGHTPSKLMQQFRLPMLALRYYLGPLSILGVREQYRELINRIQPDLVQALRIPYEGMLASYTPAGIPVVMNSWGNDFTLHAEKSGLMRWMTGRAMARADGFSADCRRDIRLAEEWGLRSGTPRMFAPGNGGLDLEQVRRISEENREQVERRRSDFLVVNPRGIRPAYVRNDVFFKAIPQVITAISQTRFFCPSMQGQLDAEKWVKELNLAEVVTLLGIEPQERLWQRYLGCNVLVSPATHDGTPNSVLEGMAYGCLPVVGNIESLREWITDGENGLLVDPNDPSSVAWGIITGLQDRGLQERARVINARLVAERADFKHVMTEVDHFYQRLISP